jgi:periplasmic protein TonB
VQRFDQRQGFLVSATVHLLVLTLLASRTAQAPRRPEAESLQAEAQRAPRVMLPPPEVLRQLLPPPPPRPQAQPAQPIPAQPAPPPPEAQKGKDRISIGPPSDQRAKVLELRREDDLTKIPKGQPNAVPSQAPTPPPAVATADNKASGAEERPGTEGLRLPPGLGGLSAGEEGRRARPGLPGPPAPEGPSIASSLKNLERRLQSGPAGLPTGTGQQMGPLFFDPEGADFTVWINHFKNEVYRNWIVPQPALMGFHGHVDFEFTVERNGALGGLRLLKSSGTAALDRAAQNALLGSRLMALPPDYGPARITMQVSFFYNEGPQGS